MKARNSICQISCIHCVFSSASWSLHWNMSNVGLGLSDYNAHLNSTLSHSVNQIATNSQRQSELRTIRSAKPKVTDGQACATCMCRWISDVLIFKDANAVAEQHGGGETVRAVASSQEGCEFDSEPEEFPLRAVCMFSLCPHGFSPGASVGVPWMPKSFLQAWKAYCVLRRLKRACRKHCDTLQVCCRLWLDVGLNGENGLSCKTV